MKTYECLVFKSSNKHPLYSRHVLESSRQTESVRSGRQRSKHRWFSFERKVYKLFCVTAVLSGAVDDVLNELNLACGSVVRVHCSPLRIYEKFAQFAGVEESVAKPVDKLKFSGSVYWLEFTVNYEGLYQGLCFQLDSSACNFF